jgi:hypothetical protein
VPVMMMALIPARSFQYRVSPGLNSPLSSVHHIGTALRFRRILLWEELHIHSVDEFVLVISIDVDGKVDGRLIFEGLCDGRVC